MRLGKLVPSTPDRHRLPGRRSGGGGGVGSGVVDPVLGVRGDLGVGVESEGLRRARWTRNGRRVTVQAAVARS